LAEIHYRMPSSWDTKATGRNGLVKNRPPNKELLALLRPCPDERLKIWRVDNKVGNARNTGPELILPLRGSAAMKCRDDRPLAAATDLARTGVVPAPSDRTRLHSLDSLRGLAAIYVVFFHVLSLPPKISIPSAPLTEVLTFGHTGVFLFFVISGFSLSMTMPRHDRFVIPWISYAISRFFRIAPAFLVMLAVSLMLHHFWGWEVASPGRVLTNVTFLFNLIPGHQQGIVAASWTIGVEMLFYVTFIPLYRAALWFKLAVLTSTICAFLMIKDIISPDYAQWTVLGYFPIFVLGMLAFDCYERVAQTSLSKQIGAALIVVGIIMLAVIVSVTRGEHILALRTLVGLGYAVLLVGCALYRPLILEAGFFTFFGTVSYSLYLVHAPVIFSCSQLFAQIAYSLPPTAAYAACVVVALSIATMIAYLLYSFVEKPGINAGTRLLRFFAANSAPVKPATPRF
jgi:peptidoglycan/LPS O-acetylase OafA/YrhL